jgi:hypothetical protein
MSNTLQHGRYGVGNKVIAASRQIWLAGLGAAVVTREWAGREAGQMFRTLVKEGTMVESRAIRLVGHRLETSVAQASTLWQRARRDAHSAVGSYADSALAVVARTLALRRAQATQPAARKRAARKTVKRGVKHAAKRVSKRGSAR